MVDLVSAVEGLLSTGHTLSIFLPNHPFNKHFKKKMLMLEQ